MRPTDELEAELRLLLWYAILSWGSFLTMHLTFRSKATEASGYRPDIDALRAIAVVSVVFYHADFKGFLGGFVGVDIFFVISGYLITRIIEADLAQGRFTIRGFYERRIRRIFPTLFAMALFCALAGAALFPSQRYKDFGKSLLALTGFVSNLYFKATSVGVGYFEPATGAQFLLHTWSLSLEEQFYVLFPVLLLVLHRYQSERKKLVLVVLMLGSFGLNLYGIRHAPIAEFYLLPGRAWELLIGALLALKPLPPIRNAMLRSGVYLAGLAGIVWSVCFFTEWKAFPSFWTVLPCLGAWLVLYAGEGDSDRSYVRDALSFRPLVFVGVISYSLYLWHWPLLVLAKFFYGTLNIRPDRAVYVVVASFVMAFFSFEWIETPFRRRHSELSRNNTVLWWGLGAGAGLAVLAICIVATNGMPQRFRTEKSRLMDRNYAEKGDLPAWGGKDCANWHADLQRYSDVNFCSVGEGPRNVLLWGDSHVLQLYPVLKEMQQSGAFHGDGLVFAAAGSCPPAEHYNLTFEGFHCDRFVHFALERAAKPDIDTVFIEFSHWWAFDGAVCLMKDGQCAQTLSGPEAERGVVEEMAGHIRALKAMGKRVIVGMPFPNYDANIPDIMIHNLVMGRFAARYAPPLLDLSLFVDTHNLRDVALREGAEVYEPRKTLCPQPYRCLLQVDGVSLYSDNSHIAASQTWILRDGLTQVFQEHQAAAARQQERPKPPAGSR